MNYHEIIQLNLENAVVNPVSGECESLFMIFWSILIYLRIGNSPTSKIVQILRDNFGIISKFTDSEVESILVLA